jgi:glutamyl-tRNA reductase
VRLICLGLSHHTSPLEVRERLALGFDETEEVLAGLCRGRGVLEAVLLVTCHRVELYGVLPGGRDGVFRLREVPKRGRVLEVSGRGPERLAELFMRGPGVSGQAVLRGLFVKAGGEAVQHLFRVAGGLDSMVVGETEILGQLKDAYELARREGHAGRVLNPLFQAAFRAAKQVRSETAVQQGAVSVASVAVEFAEVVLGTLAGRRVLVMGAGDTGGKVARALLERGVGEVRIANRTEDRGLALAASLGAGACAVVDGPGAWEGVDVVVGSVSAPGILWDVERLRPVVAARGGRPLLLLDLGMPRNFDPGLAEVPGVWLRNLDDLRSQAGMNLARRREEAMRGEDLVREAAREAYRRVTEGADRGVSGAG